MMAFFAMLTQKFTRYTHKHKQPKLIRLKSNFKNASNPNRMEANKSSQKNKKKEKKIIN